MLECHCFVWGSYFEVAGEELGEQWGVLGLIVYCAAVGYASFYDGLDVHCWQLCVCGRDWIFWIL